MPKKSANSTRESLHAVVKKYDQYVSGSLSFRELRSSKSSPKTVPVKTHKRSKA